MKRIIDGVTYNTATSTKLAQSEYEATYNHIDYPCWGVLYQTRGGAFFVHERVNLGFNANIDEIEYRDRFDAYSVTEAQQWIMNGDVEVFYNPFDDPPEAEAEAETSATIYVRVPSSLKQRIDAAAKADGLSGNAWTMRCAERCLARNNAEEEKASLKRYLDDMLSPAAGRGPITAARLREALEHVAAVAAGW